MELDSVRSFAPDFTQFIWAYDTAAVQRSVEGIASIHVKDINEILPQSQASALHANSVDIRQIKDIVSFMVIYLEGGVFLNMDIH